MSDYVLSYNGVALQNAVPGARVLDVVVQPLPISVSKLERLMMDGSNFVRKRVMQRTITIELELPLNDAVGAYAENARKLRSWAEASEEKELEVPDYPSKKIASILTGISDISINEWYKPVKLTFTAFSEPRFVSLTESEGAVGTQFTVAGDAEVRPKITHVVSSRLSAPEWTLDSSHSIRLTGTYSSGTIVIDLEKGYVSRNGSSIMTELNQNSRFIGYLKGNHTITGPSGGAIAWRERWND
ncbi:MAG: phage tail family protein [Clostridia bacterium]